MLENNSYDLVTNTSTGAPVVSPSNTLRQPVKTNDLREWTPAVPVLLCAGDQDPTVFYLNTQLMQHYWMANAPSASVRVLDVDSGVTSGALYASLKNGFAAAKTAVAGRGARRRERWWSHGSAPGVSCHPRSAGLPECGKILFRRIQMRVKWLPSLTSC
jgi:hypothetical protein